MTSVSKEGKGGDIRKEKERALVFHRKRRFVIGGEILSVGWEGFTVEGNWEGNKTSSIHRKEVCV